MANGEGPLLELAHVAKRYPYRAGALRRRTGWIGAVVDVSLSVEEGEVLGLVGESGCGKTTLAKLIAGLIGPTDGEIRYGGQRRAREGQMSGPLRREIQMVFQDPTSSLNPRQRVGSAVAEPLHVHRLVGEGAALRLAVERLLAQVGLPGSYERRFPRELSGGERQRVAIARALAAEPRLLILDEPVASLDVYVGAQILELLAGLQRERRLTYLVISHDLRVVGSMCRRVAVMYLGRIVELAPAAALFRQPAHPYTELLLESAGLRAVGLQDQGEVPSPLHPPSGCAFRTRCPLAAAVCERETPPLVEKTPGRSVACHFRP
ncbi:MAG: ABC transporter ATP-binding protein [Candidatus Omnitrophica bacterium]|nr:ABC transporter ATP-binding protein [Candidatus Omnitrophota bacterium]